MMTNTKFTELLNLYLDHEIGIEDAAALEAEIQQNPERREIYRQYCQIHKGCAQLASSFAGAGAADLTRDLAARRNQSSRRHFAAWTVGLGAMAAACFAVVLLNRESASVVPASVAQANQAAPTQVAVAPALEPLPAESDIEIVPDDSATAAASLFFAVCRLMMMGICVLPLAWRGVTSASAIPSSESRMKGLPTCAYKRLKCRCLMHLCMFSTSFVSACLAMYS